MCAAVSRRGDKNFPPLKAYPHCGREAGAKTRNLMNPVKVLRVHNGEYRHRRALDDEWRKRLALILRQNTLKSHVYQCDDCQMRTGTPNLRFRNMDAKGKLTHYFVLLPSSSLLHALVLHDSFPFRMEFKWSASPLVSALFLASLFLRLRDFRSSEISARISTLTKT